MRRGTHEIVPKIDEIKLSIKITLMDLTARNLYNQIEKMIDLEQYYLVKCFDKNEYRAGFLTGENIYIKNLNYFWNTENTFQKDSEGIIAELGSGKFIIPSQNGTTEIPTHYGSIYIIGYISCYYLLNKSDIYITEDDTMVFSNSEALIDFEKYLTEYAKGNNNVAYMCILDGKSFWEIFRNDMVKKGYTIIGDAVYYYDMSVDEKIACVSGGEFQKVVFTKPTKYSYQKEFRIFLSKGLEQSDHISESDINFAPSIVGAFDYKL